MGSSTRGYAHMRWSSVSFDTRPQNVCKHPYHSSGAMSTWYEHSPHGCSTTMGLSHSGAGKLPRPEQNNVVEQAEPLCNGHNLLQRYFPKWHLEHSVQCPVFLNVPCPVPQTSHATCELASLKEHWRLPINHFLYVHCSGACVQPFREAHL